MCGTVLACVATAAPAESQPSSEAAHQEVSEGEAEHPSVDLHVVRSEYQAGETRISVILPDGGDDAGPYLRFSVTFEASGQEEEKKVIDELRNRLKSLDLQF